MRCISLIFFGLLFVRHQANGSLESKLIWFFDQISTDQSFRELLLFSNNDQLTKSLDFLKRPTSDSSNWLVVLDPQSWPHSKAFGVLITGLSNARKCPSPTRAVAIPENILSSYKSDLLEPFGIVCLFLSQIVQPQSLRKLWTVRGSLELQLFTLFDGHVTSTEETTQNPKVSPKILNTDEIGEDVILPYFEEDSEEPTEDYLYELGHRGPHVHDEDDNISLLDNIYNDQSATKNKPKIDYQTAFYVVLGLYIFSMMLVILSLCVNYISGSARKKWKVDGNLHVPIQADRGESQFQQESYVITTPTSSKVKEVEKSWVSAKKTPIADHNHHPDFFNHTPLAMSPDRFH